MKSEKNQKTKKIKTYLNEKDCKTFEQVKKYYDFKSDYALFSAAVRVVIHALYNQMTGERKDVAVEDEIRSDFEDFSQIEGGDILCGATKRGGRFSSSYDNLRGADFIKKTAENSNKNIRRNVAFADRYIEQNYKRIEKEYANITLKRHGAETSEDVMHDVLCSLYYLPSTYTSYEQFKEVADEKFFPKAKKQ